MENQDPPASSSLSESTTSYTRADAVAGNADAQFGLALCYVAGPAPQDYAQAAEWYCKAAEQNHRLAQFNLGLMFECGQGVQRDDGTAVMWIRRAANGGDAGAQYNLAGRCQRASVAGSKIEAGESRIEAYKWFKLAAAQDYHACDPVSVSATLHMSGDEVAEGDRRANAFVVG